MRRRPPVLTTLGGLAIGFVCFGLALAYVFYVVRPSVERGTAGRRALAHEHVRGWAKRDAFDERQISEVLSETHALLDELAAPIGVSADDLPLPVEIFMHQDVEQMVESVMHRDDDYRSVGWAALDWLPWDNARLRVAQMLLAYGWGKCTSQILYAGMMLVAAYPDREFHSFVAALPENARHSVQELCSLEASGSFPKTFYQVYASPHANRFAISFGSSKRYYDLPDFAAFVPDGHSLYLECASLVQYLIDDLAGLRAAREAWGVGFSRNILSEVADSRLDELTSRWHDAALAHAVHREGFAETQARLLLESGHCDRAYALTQGWTLSEESADAWDLMLLSAWLAADREQLSELLSDPASRLADVDVREVCSRMLDGSVLQSEVIRLILSPGIVPSQDLLGNATKTIAKMTELLQLDANVLPPRITAIVCTDQQLAEDVKHLVSTHELPTCLIVLRTTDDLLWALAHSLPSYALGETRSMLLKRGVATAIVLSPSELLRCADILRSEGGWQSLGMLTYMGHDQERVDIQAAYLVQTLLDRFGSSNLRRIWHSTSILGGGVCLDSAMKVHTGMTRSELEQQLAVAREDND